MNRKCGYLLSVIICLLIAGCGGGGGGTSGPTIAVPGPGPGDQGNYFPSATGNTWEFQGTQTTNGQGAESYHRTVTVAGTKTVNGVLATVINISSTLGTAVAYDEYFYKAGNGIFSYGSSNTQDVVTAQLSPYPQLLFPVTAGTSFPQFSKSGLDSGEDLDGDGINEKVDISATATVADFQNVTLSIGTFPAAARLVQTANYKFTLSLSRQAVSATEVSEIYLASGVGIIKQTQSITIPAASYTLNATEELTGYLVDGQGKGVVGRRTLATGLANAGSDLFSPGAPAVAFDGTNFLVVSRRVAGSTGTVTGTIVTPANKTVSSFDIGTGDNLAGLAFGSSSYLVAFSRDGQIILNRISPAGVLLDGPSGIAIPSQSTSNFAPVVAFDGTNFLVVWQQFTSGYDIQGALVSPSGQILSQFPVFAATGEQVEPAVAFDGTNYMVIWRDTRSGSGPASDTDIVGTRVSPDGTVLDPAGIPITTASGVQGSPQLCFLNGQYLAVWEDYRSGSAAIYGARVGKDGSVIDAGGLAIDTAHTSTYRPTVAPSGDNFLVVWRVGDYVQPAGIYGVRINASGQTVSLASGGAIFPISGPPTEYAARFVNPAIATGSGVSLLAWINNREVSGTQKDLQSVLLYPF